MLSEKIAKDFLKKAAELQHLNCSCDGCAKRLAAFLEEEIKESVRAKTAKLEEDLANANENLANANENVVSLTQQNEELKTEMSAKADAVAEIFLGQQDES